MNLPSLLGLRSNLDLRGMRLGYWPKFSVEPEPVWFSVFSFEPFGRWCGCYSPVVRQPPYREEAIHLPVFAVFHRWSVGVTGG